MSPPKPKPKNPATKKAKRPRPKGRAKALNTPNKKNRFKAQESTFVITHYTFALEADPMYEGGESVVAPGLDPTKTYKNDFLYGKRGVIMQGTGLAKDGQYVTLDWHKTNLRKQTFSFKYGTGRNVEAWKTVAADPKVLPMGTKIEIEIYKDKGTFLVTDTGGSVKGQHIDVFAGAITVEEANKLGKKRSKVTVK